MADLEIPSGFGLWNLEITHAGIAHKAITTLGFESDGSYAQADNDAVMTNWVTALRPLHDNEVTYGRMVTLLNVGGSLQRFESSGTTTGSRGASTIAPPQNTWLVRKVTGLAGRRYRGRMYIPFISIADVQQTGQLQTAAVTLLATACTSMFTNLIGAGVSVLSLRLLHASSPLSATPSPTAITSLQAQNVCATQRRRLERS